jgi:hypothetical protein
MTGIEPFKQKQPASLLVLSTHPGRVTFAGTRQLPVSRPFVRQQ